MHHRSSTDQCNSGIIILCAPLFLHRLHLLFFCLQLQRLAQMKTRGSITCVSSHFFSIWVFLFLLVTMSTQALIWCILNYNTLLLVQYPATFDYSLWLFFDKIKDTIHKSYQPSSIIYASLNREGLELATVP